jgi:hypothetical protein
VRRSPFSCPCWDEGTLSLSEVLRPRLASRWPDSAESDRNWLLLSWCYGRWDWQRAGVPEALTEEAERKKRDKQRDKKKRAKVSIGERWGSAFSRTVSGRLRSKPQKNKWMLLGEAEG